LNHNILRVSKGADELVIQAKELNYQNTIIKPVTATLWHYAKTGYVKATKNSSTLIIFHITKFDEDKFDFVKILVL
jgi:hypothetical protein